MWRRSWLHKEQCLVPKVLTVLIDLPCHRILLVYEFLSVRWNDFMFVGSMFCICWAKCLEKESALIPCCSCLLVSPLCCFILSLKCWEVLPMYTLPVLEQVIS